MFVEHQSTSETKIETLIIVCKGSYALFYKYGIYCDVSIYTNLGIEQVL